ncbi:MAG: DUF3352 domain-containing protein [Bacteroidetes bacterium]|nr:DUF3352 domain-containing protein [Bacteroidota bacterium]
MKKGTIVLFIFLFLGIGGYFSITKWFSLREVNTWSMVPENAVWIYQSDNLVRTWNNMQANPIWEDLTNIHYFKHVINKFQSLDSLSGISGGLDKLFTGSNLIISAHITAQDGFDYLFIVPLDGSMRQELAGDLIQNLKSRKKFNWQSRTYQGFTINEVSGGERDELFSYFIYEKHFVGSFAPVLVEDVIRTITKPELENFQTQNSGIFEIAKLENDEGNIYINIKALVRWLGVFSTGNNEQLKLLEALGSASFLDLKINNDNVLLNGFSLADITQPDYLSTFYEQQPGPIRLKQLVPNRTSILYHFSFDDLNRWYRALHKFWRAKRPGYLSKVREVEKLYKFKIEEFFHWFGDEMALLILESIDIKNPDRLVMIKTKELEGAYNQLNRLTEKVNNQIGDSLYRESFSGVPITQLYIPEFPSYLLGEHFKGFEQCFYLPYQGYIVFGNSIQSLKSFINDVSLENTWGKSISQNAFLESTLNEANISMMVNTSRAWEMLQNNLSPKWVNFSEQYGKTLKNFNLAAVQFSYVDNKYYTSIYINHQAPDISSQIGSDFETLQTTELDTTIITKPFVVRNYIDNSHEILIQDANNYLYLISSEGNVLWKNSIGTPIRSNIHQIDFYRNGRLQYIFATDTGLYILDRTGKDVENYPLWVFQKKFQHLSVIDYDNSKRYRFLLSDEKGNLYMYNRDMQNLEGWRPRYLDFPISAPVSHIRVRNHDGIIAVQENGLVNIITRRGTTFSGFPLDLTSEVYNPLFIEAGSRFSNTYFTTITADGEVVKFNLEGDITSRNQLYKPTRETIFKMVIDPLKRNYVIAQQELNRMSIFNRDNQLMFEKDYITSEEMDIQYYRFGSGFELFAINDQIQGLTYLYNATGELINFQPVVSDHRVAVLHKFGKYHVYTTYQNNLTIYTFSN